MKLLQVTILCLLSSLCRSGNNTDVTNTTNPVLSSAIISATTVSVSTPGTTSSPNLTSKSIVGLSPTGTTNKESLQTSLWPTVSSLTTKVKGEEGTTNGVTKSEFITTNATVTSLPLPPAVSALQSSHNKTENQSSTKTTERQVTTLPPDTSLSKTSTSPSKSLTTSGNISQSQGAENAKNISSSSTNPSYSSIILPVVIALIVVTLSVFVLVGLYRMCRKTDPGTPENGNDQPQSNKESVKLLTVKTISHESDEHSAQGKTKN